MAIYIHDRVDSALGDNMDSSAKRAYGRAGSSGTEHKLSQIWPHEDRNTVTGSMPPSVEMASLKGCS